MNCRQFSTILFLSTLFFASCENRETVVQTLDNGFREEFQIDKKSKAREGFYKKFRDDGSLLASGTYRTGKLDGKYTLFYTSGKTMQEETYRDDLLEGSVYSWYESGVLEAEEPYRGGKHEGELKRYHENGKLKVSMAMKNGVEDGPVKYFWPNGNLQQEGVFQIGVNTQTGLSNEDFDEKWHGERKQYDENGRLTVIQNCDHGFCTTTWQLEK